MDQQFDAAPRDFNVFKILGVLSIAESERRTVTGFETQALAIRPLVMARLLAVLADRSESGIRIQRMRRDNGRMTPHVRVRVRASFQNPRR